MVLQDGEDVISVNTTDVTKGKNERRIRFDKSLNNVFLFLIYMYLTGFVSKSWSHHIK